MRWFVGILAVATVLFSAGSIYFAYMAGLPSAHEMEGLAGHDAPRMQWIVGPAAGKALLAIGMGLAALLYALDRMPT